MNSFNSVYQYIEIEYGDPISSIALNDNILVIGSMLGRAVSFDIKHRKSYLLFSAASEHITGTEVYKEGKFAVAIGDYEVIHILHPVKEYLSQSRSAIMIVIICII